MGEAKKKKAAAESEARRSEEEAAKREERRFLLVGMALMGHTSPRMSDADTVHRLVLDAVHIADEAMRQLEEGP